MEQNEAEMVADTIAGQWDMIRDLQAEVGRLMGIISTAHCLACLALAHGAAANGDLRQAVLTLEKAIKPRD